jgi:segregation and condensation protein A
MAATADYKVKLDAFEGPLDLLLHLVKTNEVDIYHLPIATITDQYLAYIEMFQELNLDVAGEYLVMAATLMYLKSRLLLPADEDDDEEDGEDAAVDLVRQLAEYQRYREVAEELRDRTRLGRDVFRRTPSPPDAGDADDPGFQQVGLDKLFEALRRVLGRAAARMPHEVSGEAYSVADAVRTMVGTLRAAERTSFAQLFDAEAPRGLIIATFVGLLELIKMGIIEAVQRDSGDEIYLRLLDTDVDDAQLQLVETYGQGEWTPADDPLAVGDEADEGTGRTGGDAPGGEAGAEEDDDRPDTVDAD